MKTCEPAKPCEICKNPLRIVFSIAIALWTIRKDLAQNAKTFHSLQNTSAAKSLPPSSDSLSPPVVLGLPLWCYLMCRVIQRAPDTNLASSCALRDILQPSLDYQGSRPSHSSVLTGRLSASLQTKLKGYQEKLGHHHGSWCSKTDLGEEDNDWQV